MLYMSIASVIIAYMTYRLVDMWLQLQERELTRNYELNRSAAEAVQSGASEELLKQFDERINKTWEVITSTKQDLSSLKLQIGLKGNKP